MNQLCSSLWTSRLWFFFLCHATLHDIQKRTARETAGFPAKWLKQIPRSGYWSFPDQYGNSVLVSQTSDTRGKQW